MFVSVDQKIQANLTIPNIWFGPNEAYWTDPTTSPINQVDLATEPFGTFTQSLLGFAVFGTTMYGEMQYLNTTG